MSDHCALEKLVYWDAIREAQPDRALRASPTPPREKMR